MQSGRPDSCKVALKLFGCSLQSTLGGGCRGCVFYCVVLWPWLTCLQISSFVWPAVKNIKRHSEGKDQKQRKEAELFFFFLMELFGPMWTSVWLSCQISQFIFFFISFQSDVQKTMIDNATETNTVLTVFAFLLLVHANCWTTRHLCWSGAEMILLLYLWLFSCILFCVALSGLHWSLDRKVKALLVRVGSKNFGKVKVNILHFHDYTCRWPWKFLEVFRSFVYVWMQPWWEILLWKM